ncbi:MAG: hypothetical protein HYX92_02895 [Chloroflexi bacterium]|nr:hypothetical protein [Chloroflexota bacterium]
MSVKMTQILDPTAEPEEEEIALAAPVGDLNGKVIGFIDNGWWSLNVALTRIQELLNQKYRPAEIIWRKKSGSQPAPDEIIEDLAKKCDLAIVGLGN